MKLSTLPYSFYIGTWLAISLSACQAFSASSLLASRAHSRVALQATGECGSDFDVRNAPIVPNRRAFFFDVARKVAATAFTPVAVSWLVSPAPAVAISGVNKVNAKLLAYGLPSLPVLPDGFTPLLEIYGKGKNREPLLVSFAHPVTWVVVLPSNNVNGEDGTIQAGEYAKGDTASLFVYADPGHKDDIRKEPKSLIEETLQKAIGQKGGSSMFQNFKVTKVVPSADDKYVTADFKYQLLTGAGFEVDRIGVATLTSQGNAVECLWTAVTTLRYGKMERTIRDIASSFRCYAEGINMSNDLFDASSGTML